MVSSYEPRLARVASAVADPARSRMLAYLLSGEYASASELAKVASITPATASGHLSKLLEARFVICEPRGRHRYYRLANAEVAHALEALSLIADREEHESSWAHPGRQRLRFARSCYGHLAGELAVKIFEVLQRGEFLQETIDGFALTEAGKQWLLSLGMHPPEPSGQRRFAYRCLDWSERRDHLAGQLADEIFKHCKNCGWLRHGVGRALEITVSGDRDLMPRLA